MGTWVKERVRSASRTSGVVFLAVSRQSGGLTSNLCSGRSISFKQMLGSLPMPAQIDVVRLQLEPDELDQPGGVEDDTMTREDTPAVGRARWHRRYAHSLFITDVVAVFGASLGAAGIRFGFDSSNVMTNGALSVSYWTLAIMLGVGWIAALQVYRTRDTHVIGGSIEELRRIVRASVMFFGLFAIVALLVKLDSSRLYLAITFPLGLGLILLGRLLWARHLQGLRDRGANFSNTLIIGGVRSANEIASWIRKHERTSYRVAGVWVPDRETAADEWLTQPGESIPVLGKDRSLDHALGVAEAEVVIVTDTEHLGTSGLKELTWQLAAADVDLLVAPNVIDVSGSRLQLTSVASMPFLHVGRPTYDEAAAWPKSLFDVIGALTILTLISPLLIVTALAVKLTDSGPVFYSQERIGRNGRPFKMLKFRSMRSGSDAMLAELLEQQGKSAGPLAKVDDDPRITKVGKVIRRLSIDELPQLFNVVIGHMSLVGPRPQRQFEVDLYDDVAQRRLRVRPGMTGLWQVSGRSDLAWEDAVRLDTMYVENWSMLGDLVILWRTVRAVLKSDGAY